MSDVGTILVGDLVKEGIVELQTGPFGSQLHAHDYVEVGVPVVPTEAIRERRINRSVLPQISGSKAAELRKHALKANDILFARRGVQATGHTAFVRKDETGFICSTGAIRLRVAEDNGIVLPEFLSHVFADRTSIEWFKFHAIGATMPNLNEGIVKSFPLLLPPIDEQKSIGEALSALDDKIELNRRMNETLEEMARALFRDWFVDFGPTRRQMEGATDPAAIMGHAFPPEKAATLVPLFPAGLGADGLPEGWGMGRLDDWAVSSSNTVKPEEVEQETSYIGLEHMPRRSIALGQFATAAKVTSNKARFHTGQVLFGKLRPYFHKVGIAPCDGICSTDIVVADGKKKEFRPFVATLMSTNEFVAYTNQSSTGTKMPRTSWKLMRAYAVPKAPLELVQVFGDLAQPMHDKILHSVSENQTLAALRDLLLPNLMSGEVQLKDAEPVL
ncbi:restriction endonuclease subunit S [Marinovum sp. 2_MG-2023]|uniref:restriction endonuclease subunit S n=1 Tax=unclassified Marinovum TaxID=2647166 RepID=UPI0026E38263|nr:MULTISPECIES: restriction endonuclease subunit S [unclassified Marinovum]MDO6729583.1 restriction endonuclease subunit S [Marinovum sp. 2_MG-2023]MDO6780263.1 restriction endonuclease subunit S [Marinovum sp. 1_MG-2023]